MFSVQTLVGKNQETYSCWYDWPIRNRYLNFSNNTRVKSIRFSLPVICRHTMTLVWPNFDWLCNGRCHRNCSISHALLVLQVNDCEPCPDTFLKWYIREGDSQNQLNQKVMPFCFLLSTFSDKSNADCGDYCLATTTEQFLWKATTFN